MNHFFDYDALDAARLYDMERYPAGADVIAGLLHIHCGKQLKDIHVLDAGCGTGHYAQALLNLRVGKLTLLDASAEMLAVAREKLKPTIENGNIDKVIECKLPDLPFEDKTFDAVMYNSVLHQLDKQKDGGFKQFPVLEQTLLATKRILRPKGVLVITTASPLILRESAWFTQLHPSVTEKMARFYPSNKEFLALLVKTGFHCVSEMSLLSGATPTKFTNYFDPDGPLKEAWRKGISAFGLATVEEMQEIEEMLHDLKEKGELEQFMRDHDRTSELGYATLFVCISI